MVSKDLCFSGRIGLEGGIPAALSGHEHQGLFIHKATLLLPHTVEKDSGTTRQATIRFDSLCQDVSGIGLELFCDDRSPAGSLYGVHSQRTMR